MTAKHQTITVSGLQIEIVWKAIKNLHLGVYPPNGRIRVAAPVSLTADAIRLAVIHRLSWIKRQQTKLKSQERQSIRRYVSGETHYLWGRSYRLNVIEHAEASKVVKRNTHLDFYVKTGSNETQKAKAFLAWYRQELKAVAGPLVEKWAKLVELPVPDWRIRHMKTKWGSCNIKVGRIWLNLELAKKSPRSLEYIIVHELAHFEERHHNERFVRILDKHLPSWRTRKKELNAAPLSTG